MQHTIHNLAHLTLARSLYGFLLVLLVLLTIIGGGFLLSRAGPMIDETLDRAVRVRTASAAMQMGRSLDEDWHNLEYLAVRAAQGPMDSLDGLADGMRGSGAQVSWIGIADAGGTVQSASRGMLVGRDVSDQAWFRNGLRGDYAGDVHESPALQELLSGPDGAARHFIDLATPVIAADGQVMGVAAMLIDVDWLSHYLRETADSLKMDLYLIGADGNVLMSTTENLIGENELRILRAARTGNQAAMRETWPDGREYFSTLVTQVTHDNLPNFGWRMIGRLDAASFNPNIMIFWRGAVIVGLGALIVLIGGTMIYTRVFLRPFSTLAGSAHRIADGSEEYPPSSIVTREAAELSAALARLQEARASAWR